VNVDNFELLIIV